MISFLVFVLSAKFIIGFALGALLMYVFKPSVDKALASLLKKQ